MSSGPRPYRSELRQRQAVETRRRVVQAAVELFARHGYQATTFAELARHAGVSVETVQKHGPKPALLQAAVELASFGVEGETDFLGTEQGRAMLAVDDPDELADFLGRMMLTINEPAAGVWMAVVGAAHGDDELRGYLARMLGLIRGQVERSMRVFAGRGWLRADVPFDDLVEAFCVVSSVEGYVRFVQLDGRTRDEYRAFVARTVRDAIFARR